MEDELNREVHTEKLNKKVNDFVHKPNVKNNRNQTHDSNNDKIKNTQGGIVGR